MTMKEVAKSCGIPYPSMQDYVAGKTQIGSTNLIKLITCLNISADWLLTGKLPMRPATSEKRMYLTTAGLKSREEIVSTLHMDEAGFADWLNDNEFAIVPQVRGEASAGGGLAPDDTVEMIIAFRAEWLRRKGDHGNMAIIRVQGDSMEPTLLSGDIVLDVMVKRIKKDLASRALRIISDNPRYEPETVEPDRVRVNGKVIWYGRELER